MRRDIIQHLIDLDLPLKAIRSQLSTLPWDSDVEVTMTKEAVKSVLERFIGGIIDSETLYGWANIIEGREDICYDHSCHNDLKQLVFDLANPELQGPFDKEKAERWLVKINNVIKTHTD